MTSWRYDIEVSSTSCLGTVVACLQWNSSSTVSGWFWIRIQKFLFCEGRKTQAPREKPSEREQEPSTTTAHFWVQVRHSSWSNIGGRWMLSLLHQPCFLKSCYVQHRTQMPFRLRDLISILICVHFLLFSSFLKTQYLQIPIWGRYIKTEIPQEAPPPRH